MNININNIPKTTAALFDNFAKFKFIQEYTLVGGTALAFCKSSKSLPFPHVRPAHNPVNPFKSTSLQIS